jgi:hypothetical protein
MTLEELPADEAAQVESGVQMWVVPARSLTSPNEHVVPGGLRAFVQKAAGVSYNSTDRCCVRQQLTLLAPRGMCNGAFSLIPVPALLACV